MVKKLSRASLEMNEALVEPTVEQLIIHYVVGTVLHLLKQDEALLITSRSLRLCSLDVSVSCRSKNNTQINIFDALRITPAGF